MRTKTWCVYDLDSQEKSVFKTLKEAIAFKNLTQRNLEIREFRYLTPKQVSVLSFTEAVDFENIMRYAITTHREMEQ